MNLECSPFFKVGDLVLHENKPAVVDAIEVRILIDVTNFKYVLIYLSSKENKVNAQSSGFVREEDIEKYVRKE